MALKRLARFQTPRGLDGPGPRALSSPLRRSPRVAAPKRRLVPRTEKLGSFRSEPASFAHLIEFRQPSGLRSLIDSAHYARRSNIDSRAHAYTYIYIYICLRGQAAERVAGSKK